MVTGIETAGVILAAFPILINGLTAYSKGVSRIRDWYGYRRILGQYTRDLAGEKVVYLNTLEELFEGIASSEDELRHLIEDPGGPVWQSEDYNQKLRTRLDHSYDSYISKLHDLRQTLEDFREKLNIIPGKSYDTVSPILRRMCTKNTADLTISIYHNL